LREIGEEARNCRNLEVWKELGYGFDVLVFRVLHTFGKGFLLGVSESELTLSLRCCVLFIPRCLFLAAALSSPPG
jgi:hypothetical protein